MDILGIISASVQKAFASFSDTFNRTTSGSLGTSSSGGLWESIKGTWYASGTSARSDDAASTYPISAIKMSKADVTASVATGNTVTISTTGTVGSIVAGGTAGFYTATITGMSSTTGLAVGHWISATNGTGALYGGTPDYVEIVSVDGPSQVTYRIKGGTTPVAGSVSNITTRGNDGGSGLAVWVTDAGNWWGVAYGRSIDTACNCSSCSNSYCNTYSQYTNYSCNGYSQAYSSYCNGWSYRYTSYCTGYYDKYTSYCSGYAEKYTSSCAGFADKATYTCEAINPSTGKCSVYVMTGYVTYCTSKSYSGPTAYCATRDYGGPSPACNSADYGGPFQYCSGGRTYSIYDYCSAYSSTSGFYCSSITYGYVACNCQTCYPPYIRIFKSASNAVSEVTRWTLSSMAAAFKVITNPVTKVITIRPYKDKAMTTQIGSDLTYTASDATIDTKFGIVLSPSDQIQGKDLDDYNIQSN